MLRIAPEREVQPGGSGGRRLHRILHLGTLGTEPGDRRLEVVQRIEALVDAREARIGDEVELLEGWRIDRPLMRIDLGLSAEADVLLDPLGGRASWSSLTSRPWRRARRR